MLIKGHLLVMKLETYGIQLRLRSLFSQSRWHSSLGQILAPPRIPSDNQKRVAVERKFVYRETLARTYPLCPRQVAIEE